MTILDAIKNRTSVRTYNGEPLSPDQCHDLIRSIESSTNIKGGGTTIRLKEFDLKGEQRPGTYGTVSGARFYLLMAVADDDMAALNGGFRMEQVVLKATEMGLGTCWIAGTLKKTDFDAGQEWPSGESLAIISPVGVPAGKKRFLEKFTGMALGSRKRKPFDTLFFTDGFKKTYPQEAAFSEALEMLRIAPSSTNSQPWRVLVDGDTVHFYSKSKTRISRIDCGIGICHFYATEQAGGIKGEFFTTTSPVESPAGWDYLISYRRI